MADIFNIAGRIHSTSQEEVVTTTEEILDATQDKKQSEVNADVSEELAQHTTQINAITGDNFVSVPAFTDLPPEGEVNTIYRVSSWDGTQVDASKYAEYAWNGTLYVLLAVRDGSGDGVFDISAYNLDGGNPTEYADISAAIAGTNVPSSVQTGGMTVRFINSSTHQYEQWRLMAASWSTTVTDWQGVDETPISGSKNLVTSGGVKGSLVGATQLLGKECIQQYVGYALGYTGWTGGANYSHIVLKTNGGESFKIKRGVDNIYIAFVKTYTFPNSIYSQIDYATGYNSPIYIQGSNEYNYTLPTDCRFIIVTRYYNGVDRTPSVLELCGIDILGGIGQNIQLLLSSIQSVITEVVSVDEKANSKVSENSLNLIDWESVQFTTKKYYNSNGILAGGTEDYSALPLIRIKPSTTYTLSCVRNSSISGIGNSTGKICFYTGNDISTFISGSAIDASTQTFTTPENANYIGISTHKYNTEVSEPCFQLGSQRNYAPYNVISGYASTFPIVVKPNSVGSSELKDSSVTTDKIQDESITTNKIQDENITPQKTNFFEQSKNLFDYTTVTYGKYINSLGNLSSSTNPSKYAASDYIPVDPTMEYLISNHYGVSGAYNCFYDSNKTFISDSAFQSVPVQIPQNAAFVRFSLKYEGVEAYLQQTQVEYGQESTAVVPYGWMIKEKYIPTLGEEEKQKISLPKKLYMLSGVNFDIFYEPILRKWNPYKYDVQALPSVSNDYVKAIKRVCTLNSPTSSSLNLKVYDADKELFIIDHTSDIIKGTSSTGDNNIKLGIIGDSYTDGGCFTNALLSNGYVPNLQMVGTRSVDDTNYITQKTDGRQGYSLQMFFSVRTGTDDFNPFYHPQGSHRYWGNTAFWTAVCGGNPTGYHTRYTHYATLFDSGWPVSPVEGDIIYDSTNSKFKEYQSGSWVVVANNISEVENNYTWEFNYSKYLAMWNVDVADIFCVYLGVNDFWIYNPTDDALSTWKSRLDIIISQYHSVNAIGKFVVLCPNTLTNPNVNKYQPLAVHDRMWKFRDFLIKTYDQRENELIYVVDTAHLIDSENSFNLQETTPFDGYPNGYNALDNKEIWANDGQHPKVSYTTLGYSLAGFIQAMR